MTHWNGDTWIPYQEQGMAIKYVFECTACRWGAVLDNDRHFLACPACGGALWRYVRQGDTSKTEQDNPSLSVLIAGAWKNLSEATNLEFRWKVDTSQFASILAYNKMMQENTYAKIQERREDMHLIMGRWSSMATPEEQAERIYRNNLYRYRAINTPEQRREKQEGIRQFIQNSLERHQRVRDALFPVAARKCECKQCVVFRDIIDLLDSV